MRYVMKKYFNYIVIETKKLFVQQLKIILKTMACTNQTVMYKNLFIPKQFSTVIAK